MGHIIKYSDNLVMGESENLDRVQDTMNIDYNSSRRSPKQIKVSLMKQIKKKQQMTSVLEKQITK